MKLLKLLGRREPPPALPEPPLFEPQVREPEPDTEPESAEEMSDIAEERYTAVPGAAAGCGPGFPPQCGGITPGFPLWWQPLQLPSTLPPSSEEPVLVVLPQLKSPMVEGGPSDPGQYPGSGSGLWCPAP